MLTVEPYLMFDGNCREAFDFYKSVFGGEFTGIMLYKDAPVVTATNAADRDKVMHIALPLGKDILLMGSDVPQGEVLKAGNTIALSLSMNDKDEARRMFTKLSAGGKVDMPLEKTFWAELFAMFTDKFGIHWMINCIPRMPGASQ